MFGRLKVLESKLGIYEDLSKEMLDKLERAVTSIQENTNKTAIILERHENRLDESDRADQLILNMLEEMKDRHEKDNELVHSRVSELQKKVDVNAKFVIGAGAVLATFVTVLQILPGMVDALTSKANAGIISSAEVVSLVHGSD